MLDEGVASVVGLVSEAAWPWDASVAGSRQLPQGLPEDRPETTTRAGEPVVDGFRKQLGRLNYWTLASANVRLPLVSRDLCPEEAVELGCERHLRQSFADFTLLRRKLFGKDGWRKGIQHQALLTQDAPIAL